MTTTPRARIEAAWSAACEGTAQVLGVHARTTESLVGLVRTVAGREPLVFDLAGGDGALPYRPFLDHLGGLLAGRDRRQIADFCKRARVYHFHRELFESLFTSGRCRRYEELFLFDAEVHYEQREMARGVLGLLAEATRETSLVFVLDNFRAASPSTLRLLEELGTAPARPSILVVLRLTGDLGTAGRRGESRLAAFVDRLERDGCFVALDPVGRSEAEPARAPASAPVDWRLAARRGEDALRLLALDEARALLVSARDAALAEGQGTPAALEFALGQAAAYAGDDNEAFVRFAAALAAARREEEYTLTVEAGVALAFALWRRGALDEGRRLARQALVEARGAGNPVALAHAFAVAKYIDEEGRDPASNLAEFRELFVVLKRVRFVNTLSAMQALFGFVRHHSTLEGVPATRTLLEGQLASVRRQGNAYRVAVLHYMLGQLFEIEHRPAEAFGEYKRSIEMRRELGNQPSLLRIFNGTGYFCFLFGDFANSLAYYEQALAILEDSRDHLETAMTLFNIAVCYFAAAHYELAAGFVEAMLATMDELELAEVPWHSRRELYALAGLCHLESGHQLRAVDRYRRAGQAEAPVEGGTHGHPDCPPYVLLEARLAANEAATQVAKARAWDEALAAGGAHPFYRLYAYRAAAREQKRGGAAVKAAALVEAGRAYADECGLGDYAPFLEVENPRSLFQLPEIPYRGLYVAELARGDAAINRLHRTLRESGYLAALQETLIATAEGGALAEQAAALVRTHFLIPHAAIVDCPPTGPPVLEPPDETLEAAIHALAATRHDPALRDDGALIGPGDPALPAGLSSMALLPIARRAEGRTWLACASIDPLAVLGADAFRLLSASARQVALALSLSRAHAALVRAATTDSLTGLCNRDELWNRMRSEHDRFRRYRGRKRQPPVVLFIDLDWFKSFNDAFGHAAGDLMLREFSGLLRAGARQSDTFARAGGDEFIAILPETDLAGAKAYAQRLADDLAARDHFMPDIAALLGRMVSAPDGKRLTCSIGIACFSDSEEEKLDDVIARADAALYRAKHNGRNRYEVEAVNGGAHTEET